MKQRWIGAWALALLLHGFGLSGSLAAGRTPVDVTQEELDRYWVVAQEDMAPTMPPLVRATIGQVNRHGRIVLDYEVTIDGKGVPVDFEFKSITPAGVDPKPFIATVMFYRYRPAPQNSRRSPVRLHGPLPFFKPKE